MTGSFKANSRSHLVRNLKEMEENYETKKEKVREVESEGKKEGEGGREGGRERMKNIYRQILMLHCHTSHASSLPMILSPR